MRRGGRAPRGGDRDAARRARGEAPVLFSAHGLPESYIRKGDPYLDEIRTTVGAVTRRLGARARAPGSVPEPARTAAVARPYTEAVLDEMAAAGERAVVVVPVAFTGEHIETLQEIDILYQGARRSRRHRPLRARAHRRHATRRSSRALADLAEAPRARAARPRCVVRVAVIGGGISGLAAAHC